VGQVREPIVITEEQYEDIVQHLKAQGIPDQATAAEMARKGEWPPRNGQGDAPVGDGLRLRLTPASQIKIRPVRWVWEDRMPAGALTLIPGREGIGKSLLLVWLTAQLTRGTLPGVHYGTPRPVIYAATEDSWSQTIAPRLIAAGADLDIVYRVEVVEEDVAVLPLTLPRDCNRLGEAIKREGVAMLALDPLMSVIAPSLDTHRDREVRVALEPLVAAADATGCAVAALAHFNKSVSADALNLITGSRAFSAVTRAAIAVARDPDADDDSCVLSQVKNNLGRLDLPSLRYDVLDATVETDEGPTHVGRLRFLGESDRTVSDILGDRSDPDERSDRDEAVEWLCGYLKAQDGEAKRDDIVKAAKADGIAERTLGRARVKARVTTQREGFGQGSVWRLPAFVPQSGHSGQALGAGTNGLTGKTGGADDPASPAAASRAYRCDCCGQEVATPRDMAGFPHVCGDGGRGRFEPVGAGR
jgi:AAA domain